MSVLQLCLLSQLRGLRCIGSWITDWPSQSTSQQASERLAYPALLHNNPELETLCLSFSILHRVRPLFLLQQLVAALPTARRLRRLELRQPYILTVCDWAPLAQCLSLRQLTISARLNGIGPLTYPLAAAAGATGAERPERHSGAVEQLAGDRLYAGPIPAAHDNASGCR